MIVLDDFIVAGPPKLSYATSLHCITHSLTRVETPKPLNVITLALFSSQFLPQIPLCKKKISITSKCRHMYGVLNVDEIKN
jgi:hypothetical protein